MLNICVVYQKCNLAPRYDPTLVLSPTRHRPRRRVRGLVRRRLRCVRPHGHAGVQVCVLREPPADGNGVASVLCCACMHPHMCMRVCVFSSMHVSCIRACVYVFACSCGCSIGPPNAGDPRAFILLSSLLQLQVELVWEDPLSLCSSDDEDSDSDANGNAAQQHRQ